MSFGDLKEKKKKIILSDIVGLDEKEQEGNFSSHLATRRTLRKGFGRCVAKERGVLEVEIQSQMDKRRGL